MSVIYFNSAPGNMGGPSVFVSKMSSALTKLGHQVVYDKPQRSTHAICIINTGDVIKKIDRNKTKVFLRIDGIYNDLYNKKFNRAIRPDMASLHNELKRDLPLVDHCIYQSEWSRDCIWNEIIKVDRDYSIIHNGCDVSVFKPKYIKRDTVSLIHVGKMRDAYLMEMLIKTYLNVKISKKKELILVGTMDSACMSVYNKYKGHAGIKFVGSAANNRLNDIYALGDIFLDVRQGCSCNNVISEAQACGLPCVCSKWGGDREMIVDKKTGVVVDGGMWDYDDKYAEGLAHAVEEIVPDLDEFKKRSREHAVKNLSIDVMIKKYCRSLKL